MEQIRKLYNEYTGLEISQAVGQVRAELTAQKEFEKSTESVLTYKYNYEIQDKINQLPIDNPDDNS